MTTREQKKRIRKRKKAIRKALHILNISLFVLVVLFTLIGVFHVFTPKKSFRNKGVEEFNKGNYEKALEHFDKALGYNQWFSDGVNVDICFYKADCYLRLYDYDKAYETYAYILEEYSDSHYDTADVKYIMVLCDALQRFSQGEYFGTLNTFVEAVDNGYPEMSVYAAMCYEKLDDYAKMKEYFDIYSRNVGMDAYLCYKFAGYYIEQKDYNTAIAYVTQGLGTGDETYERQLRYTEIVCNEKLGKFNEAFALAKEYAALYPDDKKGADLYAYLDTRVNVSTTPVNDIFGVNSGEGYDSEDGYYDDSEDGWYEGY